LAHHEKLSSKAPDEIRLGAFGFAEKAEFRKLIDQTAKQLSNLTTHRKF
jgi:hypothetical protein